MLKKTKVNRTGETVIIPMNGHELGSSLIFDIWEGRVVSIPSSRDDILESIGDLFGNTKGESGSMDSKYRLICERMEDNLLIYAAVMEDQDVGVKMLTGIEKIVQYSEIW